jgi:hypothetical protein
VGWGGGQFELCESAGAVMGNPIHVFEVKGEVAVTGWMGCCTVKQK